MTKKFKQLSKKLPEPNKKVLFVNLEHDTSFIYYIFLNNGDLWVKYNNVEYDMSVYAKTTYWCYL